MLVRGAADGADLAVGGVEGGHRRVRVRPPPGRVEAAAVAVLARAGLPVDAAAERRAQARARLRRLDRRAVHLRAEQPADEQRLVADHLGREPEPRAAGEQPVVRVALEQLGRDPRRLPVRGRRDQQLEELLQVPVAARPTRSPASRATRDASAARPAMPNSSLVRDEADAEDLLPVAVGDHPGRQRVVLGDQPARQRQPVARRLVGQRRETPPGRPRSPRRRGRGSCRGAGSASCRRSPAGQLAQDRHGRLGLHLGELRFSKLGQPLAGRASARARRRRDSTGVSSACCASVRCARRPS